MFIQQDGKQLIPKKTLTFDGNKPILLGFIKLYLTRTETIALVFPCSSLINIKSKQEKN